MRLTRRGLLGATGAALGAAAVRLPAAQASPLVLSRIEGTDASVALLPGDVTTLLVHAARRFSYEIRPLGQGDVRGLASGTGLDLLPGQLSSGSGGDLFPHELLVLRDVLADCGGLVRWGGDDPVPHEGRLRLDVPPGDPLLGRAVTGLGRPGSPVDVLDPARRVAALRLQVVHAG